MLKDLNKQKYSSVVFVVITKYGHCEESEKLQRQKIFLAGRILDAVSSLYLTATRGNNVTSNDGHLKAVVSG